MEPLQPLRIADIGLAPWHVLGIARVDKKHGKSPGIEKLENRNPVDTGRFHDHGLDTAFSKPVDQPMQIGREGTEAADWKGWAARSIQIPKRDRRDGVTTLKCATAHGPGFLTGSRATKIVSAAPFRPQSSGSPFLSHRRRAAPRSVF